MSRCEVCLGEHATEACTLSRDPKYVQLRVEDLHRLAQRVGKAHAAYVTERGALSAALEVVDEAERIVEAARRQLGGAA